MELWPPPQPPETEAIKDLFSDNIQYRVRCPWCTHDTGWCISWIAAWGRLADHFLETHGAAHDVIRQRWGLRPKRRDMRDRTRPVDPETP